MGTDLLLGLDIGTTHVKAALVNAATLQVTASAQHEVPLLVPQPGYAEQNPEDWWLAVVATAREIIISSGVEPSSVLGIGLSGQMHGTVCLDAAHQPVRHAIIWADQRSVPQMEDILSRTSQSELAEHAPGWPAAGYMALTLMWLQEHEPDTIARTDKVLLPKDYVRLWLTGEVGTDISDAAATWLFDVSRKRWSDWLLDLCNLDTHLLPVVLNSIDAAGMLTKDAADTLGLPAGIPVVAGCADIAAQALGCGVIEPGMALLIIGTGGQVLAPIDRPVSDPLMHSYLYNHAVPDRWYAQAAILCGGLGLRWLRDILQVKDYEHLSALASQIPPGSEGLLFIPHLAGRRLPAKASARGGFVGLSLHHGREHLARAVMEGVAFAMKECLDASVVRANELIPPLRVSGGAVESAVWKRIITDVLGASTALMPGTQHACVGAAMLAGLGAGIYVTLQEATQILPRQLAVQEPISTHANLYSDIYRRFCQYIEWM